MSTPIEDEILESVVAIQNTVSGIGRVHDRTAIPVTDQDFVEIAVDDNQLINAVFIRPVAFSAEYTNSGDVAAHYLTLEFIYMFGFVKNMPHDNRPSEYEFFRLLFATRDAIESSRYLGFDPAVTHTGLRTSSDIPPIQLQGSYYVHSAVCRLSITLAEC